MTAVALGIAHIWTFPPTKYHSAAEIDAPNAITLLNGEHQQLTNNFYTVLN